MVVVSDTGPLRYLVEIEWVGVLPRLYGEVLTTPEVLGELRLAHFPAAVREWAGLPPEWLRVESPKALAFEEDLDAGEASALSLARERSAELVLIDERDGSALARSLGFEVYGTLGILALAGARGHLDFELALGRLTGQTLFRHSAEIVQRARERYLALRGG